MNEITSVPMIDLNHISKCCEGKNVLLKIDVEGHEETVLTGSMILIKKLIQIIIIDCNQKKDIQM